MGAAVGGLLVTRLGSGTSKIISAMLGVLAKAWASSELGKSLDDTDKEKMQNTAQKSLENNKTG